VGAFSADGQWWWDGAHWVATTEILLTIPETEFERSGRLKQARNLVIVREWMTGIGYVGVAILLLPIFVTVYVIVQHRLFKGYRTWTLEQLSSATAQLLGPEEPMLAGETTAWPPLTWWPRVQRDFAVAATRTHVLMYWFTDYDSPVCRVIWVARPEEVDMRVFTGLLGKRLAVSCRGRWWTLRGLWGAFEPEQVLQTWAKSRQEQVGPVVTSTP
jgi:hypothetical protein